MAKVSLLCGPVCCGKSARIVEEFQAALRARGPGGAMLLLPNTHRAEAVRIELLLDRQLPALWKPPVLTFPELASRALEAAGRPARELSAVGERSLMRGILIRLQDHIRYFRSVMDCPGFVDALCDFIGELKRAGIEPAEFRQKIEAANFRGNREKELADLYEGFQSALLRLDVYDVEGRFWLARDLLAGEKCPLDIPPSLFVDGFESFTTTQLDMLEALAGKCEALTLTLTCEGGPRRKELFAATRETFDVLRRRFPELEVLPCALANPTGALGHLRQYAFDDRPPKEDAAGQIQVIKAPGRRKEIEAVGREIRSLLQQGVPPADIGVIFRSLADTGDLIADVFHRLGIPTRMGQWMSAEAQTACRTILNLLRILQDDFRRADVIQFLNSSYVCFEPGSGGAAFGPDDLDQLARRARITSGKGEWFSRIEAACRRWESMLNRQELATDEERVTSEKELAEWVEQARAAEGYFRAFTDKFDSLPARATHAAMADGLMRLIHEFGIPSRLVDEAVPEVSSANVHAFEKFKKVIEDLVFVGHFLEKAEGAPVQVSLGEFVRDLRTGLSHAVFQPEGSRQGRVQVLEAHQARQMTFPYVFLGGLVEKEFPLARREDIFYRDAERRRLARAGLALDERLPQQQEEAMLFYGAACAAEKRLTFSYPVTNAEGREILPSYYVDEALRCFGTGVVSKRVRLSEVVPQVGHAANPAELLESLALERALPALELFLRQTKPAKARELLFTESFRAACSNAIAGGKAEQERETRGPFGPYDGVLASPDIQADLAERFGSKHQFSPNQLNTLAKCTFQYFASYVLGLNAMEDKSEEADNLERGVAFHGVLSRFFQEAKKTENLGTSRICCENESEALSLLEKVVGQYFRARQQAGLVGDPKLWELERRALLQSLRLLLKEEAKMNGEDEKQGLCFEPSSFEFPYGSDSNPPVFLSTDRGTIRIGGRIDRVDVFSPEEGDTMYRVWDYKLGGGRTPKHALDGLDFQLPVYVLAARAGLFQGQAECERCGYYKMRRPIEKKVAESNPTKAGIGVDGILKATQFWLSEFLRRLKAGQFEVAPRDPNACRYCDYADICRLDRFRARQKKQPEPEMPKDNDS